MADQPSPSGADEKGGRTVTPAMDNPAFTYDNGKPLVHPALPTTSASFVEHDVEPEVDEAKESTDQMDAPRSELLYTVEDVPTWYISCLLGLQHYLTMVGSTITIPFFLTPFMCIDDTDTARAKIMCTIFFVSGLVTLLQTTFGVRLPIVQGGTFAFFVPVIAILTNTFPACQELPQNMTAAEKEEEWQLRMREVQGAIAVAAIFQFILGITGVIGFLLNWITPLAITPTVTLVGLSLFSVASDKAAQHWGISFMTMAVMVLFSQFLMNVPLPFPAYKKGSGCYYAWFEVFKLFPVMLAILLSWAFCWILTVTDVFSEDSKARTDLSTDIIRNAPWFRVPYPGQWGMPTVSMAGVIGMLGGVIASIMESIGDYYACARMAGASPPPFHAVNRGITIEGIGCVLAGMWGTGTGTTSYSENIGAIGVTRVGSRRVVQMGGIVLLLVGMLGKLGALFVSIPEPVVGGVFCIMFSMITAVGLSSLQYVDLNSSRNLFIIGFSIFMGLAVPKWIESNPDAIKTGDEVFDQILRVILQTSMLIGGLIGIIFDNTIPGTPEERGLLKWRANFSSPQTNQESQPAKSNIYCYDLPFGMDAIRRASWTKYLPISPTFTGFSMPCRRQGKIQINGEVNP